MLMQVVKHIHATINADSLINAKVLSQEMGRLLVNAINDIIRNIPYQKFY